MQNLVRRKRRRRIGKDWGWTSWSVGLFRCPNGVGQLFRPNNNYQTCAQVDTALRKGLATYGFGLKVPLVEKLTLGERRYIRMCEV